MTGDYLNLSSFCMPRNGISQVKKSNQKEALLCSAEDTLDIKGIQGRVDVKDFCIVLQTIVRRIATFLTGTLLGLDRRHAGNWSYSCVLFLPRPR